MLFRNVMLAVCTFIASVLVFGIIARNCDSVGSAQAQTALGDAPPGVGVGLRPHCLQPYSKLGPTTLKKESCAYDLNNRDGGASCGYAFGMQSDTIGTWKCYWLVSQENCMAEWIVKEMRCVPVSMPADPGI